MTDAAADNLRDFVRDGGTALVGYFSGIVDEHDHIRPGGYPGALRDLLGVRTEEFFPLRAGESVRLDGGTGGGTGYGAGGGAGGGATADLWTEWLHLDGAVADASYVDGPLPGVPALTRHAYGTGTAWYLATRPDPATLAALVTRVRTAAGVEPAAPTRPGVEVVRRHGDGCAYLFVLNHTAAAAEVAADGVDLLTGEPCAGTVRVAAGGAAVVREIARDPGQSLSS
jgi:beta-galactosidase